MTRTVSFVLAVIGAVLTVLHAILLTGVWAFVSVMPPETLAEISEEFAAQVASEAFNIMVLAQIVFSVMLGVVAIILAVRLRQELRKTDLILSVVLGAVMLITRPWLAGILFLIAGILGLTNQRQKAQTQEQPSA